MRGDTSPQQRPPTVHAPSTAQQPAGSKPSSPTCGPPARSPCGTGPSSWRSLRYNTVHSAAVGAEHPWAAGGGSGSGRRAACPRVLQTARCCVAGPRHSAAPVPSVLTNMVAVRGQPLRVRPSVTDAIRSCRARLMPSSCCAWRAERRRAAAHEAARRQAEARSAGWAVGRQASRCTGLCVGGSTPHREQDELGRLAGAQAAWRRGGGRDCTQAGAASGCEGSQNAGSALQQSCPAGVSCGGSATGCRQAGAAAMRGQRRPPAAAPPNSLGAPIAAATAANSSATRRARMAAVCWAPRERRRGGKCGCRGVQPRAGSGDPSIVGGAREECGVVVPPGSLAPARPEMADLAAAGGGMSHAWGEPEAGAGAGWC